MAIAYRRATFAYQDPITADSIIVEINGTRYTVQKDADGYYGSTPLLSNAYEFTIFPFCIARINDTNYVYVNNKLYQSGAFNIKLIEETTEVSECFETAVKSISGIAGYECSEDNILYADTDVTTRTEEEGEPAFGEFAPTAIIDADSITVLFNGESYTVAKTVVGSENVYGDLSSQEEQPDFSNYPFLILVDLHEAIAVLVTENPGTYTIRISGTISSVDTTDCFKKAVQSLVPFTEPLHVIVDGEDVSVMDKTVKEIWDAFVAGRPIIAIESNGTEDHMQIITQILADSTGYEVAFKGLPYIANTMSDYPKHSFK